MTNTTDITNLTDAALDVLLNIKADPAGSHPVDHLTPSDRSSLAASLGWNVNTAFVKAWIKG